MSLAETISSETDAPVLCLQVTGTDVGKNGSPVPVPGYSTIYSQQISSGRAGRATRGARPSDLKACAGTVSLRDRGGGKGGERRGIL